MPTCYQIWIEEVDEDGAPIYSGCAPVSDMAGQYRKYEDAVKTITEGGPKDFRIKAHNPEMESDVLLITEETEVEEDDGFDDDNQEDAERPRVDASDQEPGEPATDWDTNRPKELYLILKFQEAWPSRENWEPQEGEIGHHRIFEDLLEANREARDQLLGTLGLDDYDDEELRKDREVQEENVDSTTEAYRGSAKFDDDPDIDGATMIKLQVARYKVRWASKDAERGRGKGKQPAKKRPGQANGGSSSKKVKTER